MPFTSRLGLMAAKACSAHGDGRGAEHTSTFQATLVTHLLRTPWPNKSESEQKAWPCRLANTVDTGGMES